MKLPAIVASLLIPLAFAACAHSQQSAPLRTAAPLGSLPASFSGQIPCADCPGILYRIDLFSDHSFQSSMTYEDRDFTFYDHGRWQLRGAPPVLELKGKAEQTSLLRVVDSNTLVMLDAEGHEIKSGLNYMLKRTACFERIEPRLAAAPLEGTNWRLIALDDKPVSAEGEARVPTLCLNRSTRQGYGSGGCNGFSGSYTLKGDRLRFGPILSTQMACTPETGTERAYFAALEEVRRWRVEGRRLELYDAGGKRLARFEAGATGG